MVLMAVSCFATDYKGDLTVTVQPRVENEDTQTTKGSVVSVNKQEDGKYTITLKDFKYGSKNLGDIELNKVDATTENGVTTLTTDQKVKIISLSLTVHIKLNGKESNGKFNANIEISKVPFIKKISATFDGTEYNPTGISNLPVNNDNEKEEIFNLQGQRISEAKPGQVVIVKKGGKAVKVVK